MMGNLLALLKRKANNISMSPSWSGVAGGLMLTVGIWTPLWFLGFLAFVIPFMALHHKESFHLMRAARTGFFLGFTFFFSVFPILSFQPTLLGVILKDPISPIILSVKFAFVLLLFGLVAGIGNSLVFIFAFLAAYRRRMFFLLSLPFFWVAWELVFRKIAFGFEWWLIGNTLVNLPVFRQWAWVGGLPSLSWLLVACNVLVFLIYSRIINKSLSYSVIMGSVLFCVVMFGYGYILYRNTDVTFPLSTRFALFQPGVTNFPRAIPLTATPEFSRYTDAISRVKPDVLIIPGALQHAPMALDDISSSFIVSLLGTLAQDKHLTTIITLPLKDKDGTTSLAMVALQHQNIVGVYRKEILMPVSDYKPSGFVGSIFPPELYGKITPFTGDNGLFLPHLYAGALICDEIFFNRLITKHKESGARLMILSGNDAAFTSDLVPKETLRTTQLRAVENRVWIVRAGKTGISAVINPRGDIVMQLSRNHTGMLIYP